MKRKSSKYTIEIVYGDAHEHAVNVYVTRRGDLSPCIEEHGKSIEKCLKDVAVQIARLEAS
jgi:hypothetical protein